MRGWAGAGVVLVLALACGDSGGEADDDGASTTGTSTVTASTGTSTSAGPSSSAGPTTMTGSTDPSDPSTVTDPTMTTTDGGSTGELPPVGSAGCGNLGPPTGLQTIDVQGQPGEYVVSIPAAYDPDNPYPLGFGFHGSGRTGPNCQDGDCAGFQEAMQDDAVLVYMTSLGGPGWTGDAEREINVTFYETVREHIADNYCIDEARVFVAGTSAGAHFANVLGCRFGDELLAISPVAGYLPETECNGYVAALVIHGVDDPSFSSGETARDFWRDRNGCDDITVPPIADVHDAVVAEPESHGCAVYQGCDPGVGVTWCEHSEGGYDGSTHGWPLFGGQEIWDFVQAL